MRVRPRRQRDRLTKSQRDRLTENFAHSQLSLFASDCERKNANLNRAKSQVLVRERVVGEFGKPECGAICEIPYPVALLLASKYNSGVGSLGDRLNNFRDEVARI